MDKDVADKMQQTVGHLNALDAMAKGVSCMQGDRATSILLDAIRGLTNKAVLSAWAYADEHSKK
jgi:hypothetical protein